MIYRLLFEEFRYMGQLIAAGLLIALPAAKRRDKFWPKVIGLGVSVMAFTMFYILIREWTYENRESGIIVVASHIAWYSGLVLIFAGYIAVCFKVNPTELLWITMFSYALQHFQYALIYELLFMGILSGATVPFTIYAAVCVFSSAALYYGVYILFKPFLKGFHRINLFDNFRSRIIYSVVLLFTIGSALMNQYNAQTGPGKLNWIAAFSGMFNSALILVLLYFGLRTNKLNVEKGLAVQLMRRTAQQFEAFKEAVNYVNKKCHDIKYQIRAARQEGGLNEHAVKEIEEKLSIYESFTDTGCKTLDIILTDKFLTCQANGISFSYMAEAEKLDKMEQSDIYTLFGNMLDNAVEYVARLNERDKRFIRLSVKPVSGALMICQENYFEGELAFSGRLPETTKNDKQWHGFGLRSIQDIVKKYGGRLDIKARDGVFRLEILLFSPS